MLSCPIFVRLVELLTSNKFINLRDRPPNLPFMSLPALWQRFEAWLQQHTPELAEELNEGAMPYEIAEAEEELGFELASELKTSLLIHNGGAVANGLIGNWDLLSLEEMLEAYWHMESEREDGNFGPNETTPNGRVKPFWWHRYWMPIVGDTDGNYLCVDHDPERGQGHFGQVILFLADDHERRAIAPGVVSWLKGICEGLEAGLFVYHRDEDLGLYVFEKPGLIEPW